MVTWSIGKIAQVAPYSGDMLPMVVASRARATPRPDRGLDELADDACLRSSSEMVSTTSSP